MEILVFLLITSTASLLPGPAVFTAVKNGVRFGLLRTLFGIVGNCSALLVLYFISTVGLGAIILSSVLLFTVMKVAGGIYLIYLGIKAFRSGGTHWDNEASFDAGESSRWYLFRESFFVGVSNPKAIAFATALLPQFIDPHGDIVVQFVILSFTSAGVSFVVLALYAALASSLSQKMMSQKVQRWFHRITGGIFVGFGAVLALGSSA